MQTDPDASEASETSTGEETEKEDPPTEAPDTDHEQPEKPIGETTLNPDPTGETTGNTDPTGETAESTDPTGETAESTDPTGETAESTDPTGETAESTDPTGETAESTDPTEETVPEGYYSVVASDGTTCLVPGPETAEQISLADIIREDDSGRKMLYVTLRDSEGRVASTTDPSSAVDEYYKTGETSPASLQGPVTVCLSFAAAGSTSPDAYYYIDLPKEFVPNGAVNPGEPVELFQSGSVRAFGGIYSTGDGEKPWRLMLHFAVIGEPAEISGGFQYSAAVSGELGDQPLDAVDFGAAGVLFFGEEASAPQVPEGFFAVMTLDGMTYTVPAPSTTEEVPIENIIKEDSGRKMMYVTLRDSSRRVVSTTDPAYTVDEYYINEETKRVDLGQAMNVYLNFAAIKEAALEGGVSEDVYYYLDLPMELSPDLKNDQEQSIVDPEEPIELFHNGVIRAFGGIYSTGNAAKPWRLKVNFADTADQVEISGGFQYKAAINEGLENDHVYDAVDFGGAGQLSFETTEGEPVIESDYALSISGVWDETGSTDIDVASANTKIDWSVVLKDNSVDEDGNPTPSIDNTLTLDMPEGHGVIKAVTPDYGYDHYYNVCPYTVTVTYKDGSKVTLTPNYCGYWVFFDSAKMGSSTGAFNGEFILKVEDPTSYLPEISYGPVYIANQLKVVFEHVNWRNSTNTPVTDVVQWEITLPTQAYNNAGIGGDNYSLKGTLPVQEDGDALTAAGSLGRGYGIPGISAHIETPAWDWDKTIGGIPQYVTTYADILQDGRYSGNYVSFEYTPNESNSMGAYYFVSRKSFAYNDSNPPIGPTSYYSSNRDALFQSIMIDGKKTTWTKVGTAGRYSGSGALIIDPVVQYQVNELFPNQMVWIFRSQEKHEGKYYWITITDDLHISATGSSHPNCWWGFSDTDGITNYNPWYYSGQQPCIRKPGTWKVAIFNTAGKDVHLEFDEYMEKFSGQDTGTGGSITNRITVSNGLSSTSTTTGFGNSIAPVASLKGEYVTGFRSGQYVDNLVRWEMELDLSQYNRPSSGYFQDRQFYLYLKLPKSLGYEMGYEITDSKNPGQQYRSDFVYVRDGSSSSWSQCGEWAVSSPFYNSDAWELAGFNYSDSGKYDLYVIDSTVSISPRRMDNGKLRIAFFTYVKGVEWNELLKCEAALHFFTEDLVSDSPDRPSYPYWALDVHASGAVPQPYLSKYSYNVRADQGDKDLHKTKLHYQLQSSTFENDRYTGNSYYYYGTWTTTDSMADSTVESNGQEIRGFPVGRLVTLEDFSFEIGVQGPLFRGEFTKEELAQAANAPDHKVVKTYTTAGYNGSRYTVTAELTYYGNMYQGFTLRLKGLEHCAHITVDYTVVLDDAALCKTISEENPDALYTVNLKNAASCGWMTPSFSKTVTTKSIPVAAALAIKKRVGSAEEWDGFTQHYEVVTTVGVSPTPYLRITDYISEYQSFANWLEGSTEFADYKDASQLSALAESMKLDPGKITVAVQLPANSSRDTIYENGAFAEEWAGSVLTMRDDLAESVTADLPGALYRLELKRTDGHYIPGGTVVYISYDATLDMDTKVVDTDGTVRTFRQSSYYPVDSNGNGGVLAVTNSVRGARAYKGIDQVPDQPAAVMSARSGWVDEEKMELICDAGAVGGKYLKDLFLAKSSSVDNSKQYSYTISTRVAQSGKTPEPIKLTDIMSVFDTKANKDKLIAEGMTETEAASLLTQLDGLLLDNLTIRNLNVYLGTSQDSTLSGLLPVYQQGKYAPIYSETAAIWEDPAKILTVSAEDKSKGFTLELAPVEFGDLFGASYDVDIDWVTFTKQAHERGLLKDGLMLGLVQPDMELTNGLWAPDRELVNVSESNVEVLGTAVGKRLVSQDSIAGMASWEVKADTGFTTGDSFAIQDAVEILLPENTELTEEAKAVVLDAVKTAMSIGNVKLVLSGEEPLTLYENGGLTEAAAAAGWKDANISLAANGLSVDVTISNQEGEKLLDSAQTYILTYDTVLDKEAYFKALTAGNLTAEDMEKAAYVLNNTANAERGGLNSSADASTTQRPGFPMDASKTGARRDGKPETMDWTLTASTEDTPRENLEIRDILAVDSTKAEETSFIDYISIKEMVINLQTGDGEPETIFDYAGKIDFPEKYQCNLEKLSAIDGEPEGALTFGENGVHGFRLSFGAAIPKNTMVTVTYSTEFDRQAYLDAGGDMDKVIAFENTMSVSAKGSDTVTKTADSSVTISETMKKTGRKWGTTGGNDILLWNIPIDLRTEYTTEELKNATVSVIDNLHPSLAYQNRSLRVYERVEKNGKLTKGNAIASSEYSLQQEGNKLTITLAHPDKYPAVEIQFETIAMASVSGLTNEAILDVNGKTVKEESEPVPDVVAVGQSGYITSMRAPEWTPEVFKNVDGTLCTEDGAFGFTITEVNADGSAMENAYTDTAFNNGEGKAVFKAIEYKTPTDGQTHYYKIAETVCDETKYQKDEKEYLVSVTLTKLTSAYQVTVTVADSEDGTNRITFQNASLIDISGEKVWDDGSDQDRKRPDQVTIHLFANGVETAVQTVTKADGDKWIWTFSKLPKTANGIPITYTVTEETVTGYSTVIEGSTETGFTVTNSYTPDKTSLNVTKVWMDANDQDGMRPGSITVKLLADGAATDKTLTLSKENNWTGTFTDLAKNKAGVPIVYTIEEVAVPGYASAITYQENTSSAMIVNFHTPEKIGIYGNKVWDDKNDADSIRPDYIEIQLLANGTVIGSQTVTAGSDGGWHWSFTNLPKYMNGKEIVYTVTETEVEGYTTTITGDTFSGFVIKNSHAAKRPSEGPGTGDNNQPMLWLVLLLVSAAGIAYAAWKLRKKEKR